MKRLKNAIKKNLVAGILIILPISLTFYIVFLLVRVVDRILIFLPPQYNPQTYLPFNIPGVGLFFAVIIIFMVGLLARNYIGSKLIEFWENMVNKIPFIRTIYVAIKQLGETIFIKKEKDFKRVVLIEYPRKGVFTLAFTTGRGEGEIQEKTKKRVLNIFVPTTPNPTSGFYLLVPEDEIKFLDMGVEDAFKLIISGGMATPERNKNKV